MFKMRTVHDPQTGKKKETTRRGFNSKGEAELAARQLANEIDLGKGFNNNPITFSEFAIKWLELYEKERGVKPGTIRIRKHEINNLNKYFENIRLVDITWNMYQEALHNLEKIFAHQTIDGIHRTGRMIFKKAIQLEVIKKDPTEYAYVVKKKMTVEDLENKNDLPKYMEKEELAKFLKTAYIHGLHLDYPIFLTLAYTGLRVGELCALKSTDLQTKGGVSLLSITKTYYNPKNNIKQFEIVTPKTESSIRKIDLDDMVVQVLKGQVGVNEQLKKEYQKEYFDQDYLFVNTNAYPGYPIYPKIIEQRMKRLLNLAKLNESLSPHSLRHTHTSLLAEAGVSIERIMNRLGHSDDKTTKNVYLHTTEEIQKRDSEKFGSLMKNVLHFD
ncbi:tyrosine-type recombinase/integrase [Cytobacillus sp. OWB-43]|uniref:site-specific integrase n=1 Tax=Cytobacillus sp. OWB-43 TaxID=3108468 RepID=UPI002AFFDE34|nr:tyrosine-type recombinase/integrase [Cytobacillus sp. OWB-43]MEA1855627.1 tyrosine-type recombinase/integrase [Cytobacillus sp. OWB-43]